MFVVIEWLLDFLRMIAYIFFIFVNALAITTCGGQHDADFALTHCCRRTRDCFPRGDRTFDRWINMTVVDGCYNPHWGPLTDRIEPKFWRKMNFVGKLENLQEDGKKLMQRIGAWEEHGKTGWGPDGTLPVFAREKRAEVGVEEARAAGQGHATDSHSRLEAFYAHRPRLHRLVTEYYQKDYDFKMLGYDPPEFNFSASDQGDENDGLRRRYRRRRLRELQEHSAEGWCVHD